MFKVITFALFLTFLPLGAFAKDKVLNILYTGAIKGELEPCGCSPKSSSGGLARLSGYITANKADLSPYLLIDAGNSMGADTPQGRLKSEVVLNSFALSGYVATAFSKDDTGLLKGPLKPLVDTLGLPAISKTRAYPASVWIKEQNLKINISTDPKAYTLGRLNILLSNGSVAEAQKRKGWDVIILSSGESLEEPVKAGGTVILSGYLKGEKLGILSLRVEDNGGISGFRHRWQTLGKDIAEDNDVRRLIDEYDTKVAGLLRDKERKPPTNKTYFGYESCAQCHQPYFEQWSGTRHAGAFASLVSVGKSKDPECVKCHTTGYGVKGGFYSATTTPGLKNIQCEQCHGAGKEHLADYTVPMAIVKEPVCLRCHTKSNSPDFNYKTYLKKIKH